MTDFVQVSTTTGTREDAERISQEIVEKRFAACAQIIGPITSQYWWKDNLETSEEWLLSMKTRMERYGDLEKAIKDIHPYETPEIIAIPILEGSREYLGWIKNETKD
jgi:periplasmic divalent cation tolerance protein